jgi:MinD superfamily P-loop ATPase
MAQDGGLPVVGRIPFDPMFTKAMVQGKPLPEYDADSFACEHLKQVWTKIINTEAMSVDESTIQSAVNN